MVEYNLKTKVWDKSWFFKRDLHFAANAMFSDYWEVILSLQFLDSM